jgi:16S rRNA (cytosine967-C5)-methyltransferase
VLRIALAQLVFLPDIGAHSAPFLAVEAVKRDTKAQHLASLMNAVLRRAQTNSARFSQFTPELLIPEALRAKWTVAYGEDALVRFGDALLDGAPLDLTLRDDDPELAATLAATPVIADTVRVGARDRGVDALPGFTEGRWWVQDAASALPARLLGLPVGATVLDFCAAPGGKAAQLVKAGYAVTAVENDTDRLPRLKENLARLCYTADIVEADAVIYRPDTPVDGVLLDAPCSATGTFRRHPEVLLRAPDIAGRVILQRNLIANAAACLKPGGILIYCVCSLEPEEGEDQAAWVGKAEIGLEPFPIAGTEIGGFAAALTPDGTLRTHPALTAPGEAGGTLDGFFVARFRKLPRLP